MPLQYHPVRSGTSSRNGRKYFLQTCYATATLATLIAILFVVVVVVAPGGAHAAVINKGTEITADNPLKEDESIQVGNATLVLQADGNFVLYEEGYGPRWATSWFSGTPGQRQTYIENGVLKIKTNTDWAGFGTSGVVKFTLKGCSLVGLDSSGNELASTFTMCYSTSEDIYIVKTGEKIPANSLVRSRDSRTYIVFQNDCNLVIYSTTGATWASDTSQQKVCREGFWRLESDGYLRTYNDNNQVVWHLGVEGSNPAALMLYECRILVIDRNEQQLYSGGRLCPNGQQGALYRKYLPNQDINAGTTTMMQSDLKDAQRLEIYIDSKYNYQSAHDKLRVDWLPDGVTAKTVTDSRISVTRPGATESEWGQVLRHVIFRTTSLDLKPRRIYWFLWGGYTSEAWYKDHYYEVWLQVVHQADAFVFCATQNRFNLMGYVVTLTTKEEDDNSLVKLNAVLNKHIWLAADDITTEGEHRWKSGPERNAHQPNGPMFTLVRDQVTCQAGYYCHWWPGEPNNCGAGEDLDHYLDNSYTNHWNDWSGAAVAAVGCRHRARQLRHVVPGGSLFLEKTEAGCESSVTKSTSTVTGSRATRTNNLCTGSAPTRSLRRSSTG